MNENEISTEIINCAIAVHPELGPGLLNFGESLMQKGITRTINGPIDSKQN